MAQPDIYTIGWICAVGPELVAATAFLDEKHDDPEYVHVNDNNTYILGRIGKHNVVIAALPHSKYGLVSAPSVARDLVRSFPNIRIGLMVGIGGGVPSSKHDIRLGDIVVSSPGYSAGGVLQYDFGKTVQYAKFVVTGHLNQPPHFMLSAVSALKAQYKVDGHNIEEEISRVLAKKPKLQARYQRPDPSLDRLYISSYVHTGSNDDGCAIACSDTSKLVIRVKRTEKQDNPMIHFGLIASTDRLMKDATIRDRLSAEKDVLCFEMDAAGLMNHFPCLLIRGICDYSDTHKNKTWQGYAAMAAAVYAKDLLYRMAPNKVEAERRLVEVLAGDMYLVKSKLDDIYTGIDKTHAEIKFNRKNEHSDIITKWLASPDVSTNFIKALKARLRGSGRWLLDSKAYVMWQKEHNSFLSLYGIPGCGKTILIATVIEDLRENQDLSQNILYFFFDSFDIQKSSFERTVRSLISQLYHQNVTTQKHLKWLYSACRDGKDQPNIESLQKTLTSMIDEIGEVWILLDALDECIQRTELLSWMQNFAQNSHPKTNIHLFVTTRPEQDIKTAIEHYACNKQTIAIQSELLEADIRNYVRARIREHDGLKRWRVRPDIQDKIEASLIKKSNGMFRWVSCQLDALEECVDQGSLSAALNDLPTTLAETYKRILKNIPPEYMHHTIRILQFLTYSERPLRLDEAVDAIAVDTSEVVDIGSRFHPHDRLPIPQEITRYCSSLVVLVRREGRYNEEPIVEEIQLAHFSVKDYLTSTLLEGEIAHHLESKQARASIAKVCLSYLLATPATNVGNLFPFARYSAQYWMNHAAVGDWNDREMFALAMRLLSSASEVASWCRIYSPDRPWVDRPEDFYQHNSIMTGLYYASLGGLVHCVKSMVAAKADVNTQGGEYGNALQAASLRGHKEIVKMLLDSNADVNAQGGEYGNALQAASLRGHKDIVQMLLEANTDINAQGGRYGNALQAASSEGAEEVVQMLIDTKADVNAQGGEYGNALQAASLRGHKKIVQMLLYANADINAGGGEYGNALQAASYGGHEEVVQILIDAKADINAKGGSYSNALQAASWEGHEEVVQLLIAAKADVNAQGGRHGNALKAASLRGHKEIVQMLLDANADINAQGGEYGNALQAASYGGHEEVVQKLIDANANVNTGGGEYGNPLQAASSGGHKEVVQMLLNANADANTQGGRHGNALQAASLRGHKEIVQMLLDANAEINAQGGEYGNALQAASYGGHEEVVQKLIDANANVNTGGGEYGNPLQAASLRGHKETVQMLLDANADINAHGGEYGNALQAASYGGHEKVVQLLLDYRADVNAQSGPYVNALQAALQAATMSYSHIRVIKVLLEWRADQVEITQDVMAAAARNEQIGKEVMALLLKKQADQVEITQNVMVAAASNEMSGKEIMALLLERRVDQVEINEDVVVAAARNEQNGKEIMSLLFERRADQVEITRDVVVAAARNEQNGKEIMALLLERRGDQVEINEDVVVVAARNEQNGKEIMALLFERRADQVEITRDVVVAAARNEQNGKEIMALLLEKRADQVEITQDVVVAAARNEQHGKDIMALLESQKQIIAGPNTRGSRPWTPQLTQENSMNEWDHNTSTGTYKTYGLGTVSLGEATNSTEISRFSGNETHQEMLNLHDAPTDYSPSNRTDLPLFQEAYISEFAQYIFQALRSDGLSSEALRQVSEAMVDSLKGFASRFGLDANTQMQLDTVYFTHKRRR